MKQIQVSSVLLLLGTLSAGSLMKKRKNNMKDTTEISQESTTDDERASLIPVFPGYQFQYGPPIFPDYRMFATFDDDDDNTEAPEARSFDESETREANYRKGAFRREVLLWPRPCGWEWDGNMYRWGPCNTFFGGPGFPW